jgi:transcription antitermination factor NusG
MEMDEDTWHLVKEVPKVLGFIGGTSDKPAAITDKEAMSILRRVEEGVDKPKPKVLFEPGEVVRVTDGPFNDFNGVVESVNYEKNRLQVAVQILGRRRPWNWISRRSRRASFYLGRGRFGPVELRVSATRELSVMEGGSNKGSFL